MTFDFQRRGMLCVVSGPSGSGKTTLCRGFSAIDHEADYAVSATTRQPRTGEKDGDDYHFLTREEFEKRATNGEFLEYAEVHGNLYGTLKSEVLGRIEQGHDVLMDIDVQGAALVRKSTDATICDAIVDIFILPPDEAELLERLRNRGTESEEELALRLTNALEEMEHWKEYSYTIVSQTKEADLEIFRSILQGERCRSKRLNAPEIPSLDQPELGM